MNTFGQILRFTDFGESHGPAIGGVLDGFPAGMKIDFDAVDAMLARRRPGQSTLTSSRREADSVKFLSGIFEGRTTGTPIAFIIENTDARSSDYDELRDTYRPNHADYTYSVKYGIRDHRGGGRASARETAARVVAGALAMQYLEEFGISVKAAAEDNLEEKVKAAKSSSDTIGALVSCTIAGVPAGLGEPIFGKLQARLAFAMMSINAAKGFEYGDGFRAADMHGSESVDTPYVDSEGKVRMRSNHSGGIQGGISNGEDISFRVAFKPIATLPRPVETIDADGRSKILSVRGRHDPCVAPRVLPVVEAMAALTIMDAVLIAKASAHL
ncbi:MAG: chorismate synthase [Bacteroidales bacterium]|nr:chorismate synthase [Bacteroidales bacterium]